MPKRQTSPRSVTPIDSVIAAKIIARRKELGLSQQALATLVGVTFQQVQKYERGANRVPASRLYLIAGVLGRSIEYFFTDKAKKRALADQISSARPPAASAPRGQRRGPPKGPPSHLRS